MTTINGDVHIHIHPAASSEILTALATIIRSQTAIMKTQAELVEDLKAVAAQQLKTATEISALKDASAVLQQKIANLETALQNAGNATPELEAAVAAVKAQAQTNDDLIPDLPPPVEPAA